MFVSHTLGWRFLCVSKKVLGKKPRIALLTANPGGNEERADHAIGSCEAGCSYYSEQWGNVPAGQGSLQLQVQGLFNTLVKHTEFEGNARQLMDSSLIAYFIPFRSPSLIGLHRKGESEAFAYSLWSRIMASQSPELVVTMDPFTFHCVGRILGGGKSGVLHETYETGWGNIKAETIWYDAPEKQIAVVRLPHLSRFRLYSRFESREHLDFIFERACKRF
ncbi:MAG: hypothetical protein IPK27_07410 [Rhodanobacteraceae bacterium]|nr:hypothetical protein [Rhodanobacteraceae bacterium]